MRFYFKFQVIKEILGKDVNSKCDIKYELANVMSLTLSEGLISDW